MTAGSPPLADRFAAATAVAEAVIYEGYVLYPYRASAEKNHSRWQFGVLMPRLFSEADGSDPWTLRTECVVETGGGGAGRPATTLDIRVTCLQVQARVIEAATADGFEPVPSLSVDGEWWTSWDEAVEHHIDVTGVAVADLAAGPRLVPIDLPADREEETLLRADGTVAGRVVRQRWPVSGQVRITAVEPDGPYPLTRVAIEVDNTTPWSVPGTHRDEAVRHALAAVHTLLAVDAGAFVSALDPPEFARDAIAGCVNERTFPVLVGAEGARDVMLSSPIILYDYPAVAPESPGGGFYDATEIDEILTLRVMTLTEEEKREARATDPRARAIIDRCDAMGADELAQLHGAIRSLRPAGPGPGAAVDFWNPEAEAQVNPWEDTIEVGTARVGHGSRVRLRPGRRADAHDLFLTGRSAVVEGVFADVDGNQHVAVILDDDPGAEFSQWHGRFLYFHPEEIEPIEDPGVTARVLVAGVGNIFLSDDGFGVEVARELATRTVPAGVKVADFGIRGIHLAYELLDGYDVLVLIDALATGEMPGTVTVFEPDLDGEGSGVVDAHGLDPAAVLGLLGRLGGSVDRVLVVGCEPAVVEEGIGLSAPIAASVGPAADTVIQLLQDTCWVRSEA